MNPKLHNDAFTHYMVSFIGGYFGIYAIISRSDFFGSAQTSNLIYLAMDLLGRNLTDLIIRLFALFFYVSAIVLNIRLAEQHRFHIKKLSMIINAAAIVVLGFLPAEMNPVIALYPVFFAMAFQWCSFKGYKEYGSATVFSTNNLRQFVTALTLYFSRKDVIQREKAAFYGFTLLSFHLGATACFFLLQVFHIRSIWFCMIPTAFAFLFFTLQENAGSGKPDCYFSHRHYKKTAETVTGQIPACSAAPKDCA